MEIERGITIVGETDAEATRMALRAIEAHNNMSVLHRVVGSRFTDIERFEPEPFLITAMPEFNEPWIDPEEPIFNYKKHEQTCLNNRRKRKRKKKNRR